MLLIRNTFLELHELNQSRVRAIVESLDDTSSSADDVAAASPNPNFKKLTDFWVTANDEAEIESRGVEPLREPLALADSVCDAPANSPERAAALGKFVAQLGITCLFNMDEGADSKDSMMTRCTLSQSGLGMPDRDYYFDEVFAHKNKNENVDSSITHP
jgi:putative endopeptidase